MFFAIYRPITRSLCSRSESTRLWDCTHIHSKNWPICELYISLHLEVKFWDKFEVLLDANIIVLATNRVKWIQILCIIVSKLSILIVAVWQVTGQKEFGVGFGGTKRWKGSCIRPDCSQCSCGRPLAWLQWCWRSHCCSRQSKRSDWQWKGFECTVEIHWMQPTCLLYDFMKSMICHTSLNNQNFSLSKLIAGKVVGPQSVSNRCNLDLLKHHKNFDFYIVGIKVTLTQWDW